MTRNFWLAIAVSSALHLTVIMWHASPPIVGEPAKPSGMRLDAILSPPLQDDTGPEVLPTSATLSYPSKKPRIGSPVKANNPTQTGNSRVVSRSTYKGPRFVTPPRFTSIEASSLPIEFTVTARLFVSPHGLVDGVDFFNFGVVPNDLLDSLRTDLHNTRLYPAKRDGKTVAATLEIVIGSRLEFN